MDNNNDKKLQGSKLWLFLWCVFHGFALLMSYAKVRFFYAPNDGIGCNGVLPSSAEQQFWPFVEFTRPDPCWDFHTLFNGVFVYYDLTEFAFYVGIGVVIYFLRNNIKSLFS